MNKKKVLIWGYYGANNFGDDLIFNALYEILNRNNQNLELFYTIKEAESAYKVDAKPVVFFGKNHSNKVVNFFLNLKIMFGTILKMDAIIIGGGTQYFEIESRKPVSILLKYLACKLMKLRGKKFINAGVGIGAINSKIGKYCLRKIFIKANYSFVRDEASKSTLVKLGVPEEKVIVGKDLSYYTDKSKTQSKESGKIKIGINVFDYYNYIENNKAKNESYLRSLSDFLSSLRESNLYELHFFALQKGTGGHDFQFLEYLVSGDERVNFYQEDFFGFIDKIGSIDICIGMRYHMAVVALQNKIPTIGLNYQPKVERELKAFGLADFVIQMGDISSSTLISKTEQIIEQKDQLKKVINKELSDIQTTLNINEFNQICKSI